ncbi:MAG: glutaredoxin family protein [Romboutsia sp.]|uniref:glutaredoxin family protein n=1 Tax=Romboutsia sp. TaxID=1965302 RepID=UPI003F2C98F9
MKKIQIYTSDSCGRCVQAKAYFKKNNIKYIEHNINKNSEARKELIGMGYMSVPVILINEEHVLGFDLKRIEELLAK